MMVSLVIKVLFILWFISNYTHSFENEFHVISVLYFSNR